MNTHGSWTRNLWIVACSLVLLAMCSVPVFNLAVYTPTNTAKQFLSALAHSDAERALLFLKAPDTEPGNALVAKALANAPTVPTDVKVINTEKVDQRSTSVTVSYRLGTQTHETTFRMERAHDTWGLYRTWKIAIDDWPRLELEVSGPNVVSLNGVSVPVTADGIPVFYPLEYTVGFNAQYLESSQERVIVTEQGSVTPVTLKAQPTTKLVQETQHIVNAQLDECAKQTTLMPTGCSFGYETNNDILGQVSWSVASYPTVSIEQSANGLSLSTTKAELIVSGRYRDSVTAAESDFSERIHTRISGTVSVVDDAVVVTQSDAEQLGSD